VTPKEYRYKVNKVCEEKTAEFYVYELWDPIKKEPFYVGRAHYHKKYYRCLGHFRYLSEKPKGGHHKNNRIKSIINQGQFPSIEIVFETFSEQESFDKEKELIKFYGRRDLNTGCLTNKTDGGIGQLGTHYSPERSLEQGRRLKEWYKTHELSQKQKDWYKKFRILYPFLSAESRNKITMALKGKPWNGKHTQEWKDHLKTHNPTVRKPVYQINIEGIVIKTFPSMLQAGKELKYKSYANIQSCCKIKHRTYMGFYWRYLDDPDVKDGKLEGIEFFNWKRAKPHNAYTIQQINSSGELVKQWDSGRRMEKATGICCNAVYKVLDTAKMYAGFIWKRVPKA
jgi:hypothetical protein